MEDIYTITEDFKLPSLGKLYNKQFDPNVTLRSMTVAEEMKRLSPSKHPYKTMSDIIEACMITKLPIPVYDLCLGDYTYLLHKLRIVTYGPEYKMQFVCPRCGEISKTAFNLDELSIFEYSDEIKKMMTITLPQTKKEVVLRFQTPHDLDRIDQKKKELKEKFPDMIDDPGLLLTIASFIDTIDGEMIDPILGLEALKKLPMMDMNYLAQKAAKLNEKVGIDTAISLQCEKCGNSVNSTFRFTNEFFGPTLD